MIYLTEFDKDNSFLVDHFIKISESIDDEIIQESKNNGSYYNNFVEYNDKLFIPKSINFAPKYLHLMKNYSPEYYKRWENNLKFDIEKLKQLLIPKFDEIIKNDSLNILPRKIHEDKNFICFEKIKETEQLSLTKFCSLYYKLIKTLINDDFYIFPTPIKDYYCLYNNELKLKYPIFNSFKWSYELPKFVCDSTGNFLKFSKFNSNKDQISIYKMIECRHAIKALKDTFKDI